MTLGEAKDWYAQNYPDIPWGFVGRFFFYRTQRPLGPADADLIVGPFFSPFIQLIVEANTHRADFGYTEGGQAPPTTTTQLAWDDEAIWQAVVNKLVAAKLIPDRAYAYSGNTYVSVASHVYYDIGELLYQTGTTVKGIGGQQSFSVPANFMAQTIGTVNNQPPPSTPGAAPAEEKSIPVGIWIALGIIALLIVLWLVFRK